jgi:hypothetical protein
MVQTQASTSETTTKQVRTAKFEMYLSLFFIDSIIRQNLDCLQMTTDSPGGWVRSKTCSLGDRPATLALRAQPPRSNLLPNRTNRTKGSAGGHKDPYPGTRSVYQ